MKSKNKYKSWNLLRGLNRENFLPWVITGDLNEILANEEKLGGQAHEFRYMLDFKNIMDECRLEDLGFKGWKFT